MWFSMYIEETFKTIILQMVNGKGVRKKLRSLHFILTSKMSIPADYDVIDVWCNT